MERSAATSGETTWGTPLPALVAGWARAVAAVRASSASRRPKGRVGAGGMTQRSQAASAGVVERAPGLTWHRPVSLLCKVVRINPLHVVAGLKCHAETVVNHQRGELVAVNEHDAGVVLQIPVQPKF